MTVGDRSGRFRRHGPCPRRRVGPHGPAWLEPCLSHGLEVCMRRFASLVPTFVLFLAGGLFAACGGGGATESAAPSFPLSAVAGTGEATLSWDAVPGATSYTLYLATGAGVTADTYASLPNG